MAAVIYGIISILSVLFVVALATAMICAKNVQDTVFFYEVEGVWQNDFMMFQSYADKDGKDPDGTLILDDVRYDIKMAYHLQDAGI